MSAVHFAIDEAHARRLSALWASTSATSVELELVACPDRRLRHAMRELAVRTTQDGDTSLTVLGAPGRMYANALGNLLHRGTGEKMSRALEQLPQVAGHVLPFNASHAMQALECDRLPRHGLTALAADTPGRRPRAPRPQDSEEGEESGGAAGAGRWKCRDSSHSEGTAGGLPLASATRQAARTEPSDGGLVRPGVAPTSIAENCRRATTPTRIAATARAEAGRCRFGGNRSAGAAGRGRGRSPR
ncbi:hypothetical protein STENM327S_04464 [Streptomyces tendae]